MLDKQAFSDICVGIDKLLRESIKNEEQSATDAEQSITAAVIEALNSVFTEDTADSVLEKREQATIGMVRRSKIPFSYIIGGGVDTGKTTLAKMAFSNVPIGIPIEPSGDKKHERVLTTRPGEWSNSIVELPFGQSGKQRVYDTPGLWGDTYCNRNIARAGLGMKLTEHRCKDCKEVEIFTLKPPENGNTAIVSTERIAITDTEKLNARCDRENLGCIYVVKVSESEFDEERRKEEVRALRQIYGKRLVIVTTFHHELETRNAKNPESIDRRLKVVDEVLGDHIPVDPFSGTGKTKLAHRLLQIEGYTEPELIQDLNVEVECVRLYAAANRLSEVVAAVFFSPVLRDLKDANRTLSTVLRILCEMVSQIFYEYSEEEFQEQAAETAKELGGTLSESFVEKMTVREWYIREPKGFFERIGALWTYGLVFDTAPVTKNYLRREPRVLAEVYYFLYSHFYDIENEQSRRIVRQGKVDERIAIDWFMERFEPHEALLSDGEAWEFYEQVGSDVLVRFWEEHHPEFLPTEPVSASESGEEGTQ